MDAGDAKGGSHELQDEVAGDYEFIKGDALRISTQIGGTNRIRASSVSGSQDLLSRCEVDCEGIQDREHHPDRNDNARRVWEVDDCVTTAYTFYS